MKRDLIILKRYVYDEIRDVKNFVEKREKRDIKEIKEEVLKTECNNEADIGYLVALENIARKIEYLIKHRE